MTGLTSVIQPMAMADEGEHTNGASLNDDSANWIRGSGSDLAIRVHGRDDVKYCVISIYIADSIFRKAKSDFRNKAVLPVLFSLPGLEIGNARQTMHISKADVEVANLLEIPVGEPMAEVRRFICAPDGTVIYLADVSYRGDYIHLDMDLKP